MTIPDKRIRQLASGFRGKKIAVVGDVMLDRYCWGHVKRVSPEAPVPVVEVQSEQTRFGGAANVANNIQALGGTPFLIGLVGDDHPGTQFLAMMEEAGLDTSGIVRDPSRPTTIKTRVIAQNQHVVRIDNESKAACPAGLQARLMDAVRKNISGFDAVIIEDYNKGVLTREVINEVTRLAHTHDRIVTVDPKFDNFLEYKQVTVFKPNRRETEDVLGGRLRSREEVEAAGKKLLSLLSARNVLMTRSEEGMTLFESTGEITHLPAHTQNVQDVSGAGDTVISTLTIALAAGATIREACVLASFAGSVVVGYVGIVPVTPEQLIAEALAHTTHPTTGS